MKTAYFSETESFASDYPVATLNDLTNWKNPLVITARQGQVTRVSGLMLGGEVVGWWDLMSKGYLDKAGQVKTHAFKKHDMVLFMEAERVHEPAREAYQRLKSYLSTL